MSDVKISLFGKFSVSVKQCSIGIDAKKVQELFSFQEGLRSGNLGDLLNPEPIPPADD
jgi:hypothetical protein